MFHTEKNKRTAAGILGAAMTLCSCIIPNAAMTASADADDENFGEALAISLYFYDANACGTGITDGPLTWRGDCHTYDGQAEISKAENFNSAAAAIMDPDGDGKMDLSGGYHDAGDHVKFNLTIGYSLSSLAMSDYLNDGVYADIGCMDHFAAVLKRGCDYLMKTTALDGSGNVVSICYQVSDLADHNYWSSPEVQTYERKTYWMSAGNNNRKICADMVNALAGTAYVLREYDSAYSGKCLKYAQAIFDFAKAHNGNEQSGNGGMYGNSADAQDEMLIASAWLYINGVGAMPGCIPSNQSYSSEFGSEYDGYLYSWDKQYQGYSWLMYKATKNAAFKTELIADYNNQGGFSETAYSTKWGWGNSRYNCAVQATAIAIADGDKTSASAKGAKFQMNYILGRNSYNYSFLVGYGDKCPTHYHHRASNPGTGNPKDDTAAKYLVYGALIGGPDGSGYQDYQDSYTYTEPALDYNACFALACAGLYRLYGGDPAAAKPVLDAASEINSSYVFGSGSVQQETTTTTETSTTTTTETEIPQTKLLGDVDLSGDVDVNDCVLLARYNTEDADAVVTAQGKINADADENGTLDNTDVTRILQSIAKLRPMGAGA